MKKIVVSMFLFGILMSAGAQVPKYVPTDSLKGWWPFNGNANDESGNGNHGTVSGATLIPDRFGNLNSAYSFDGSADYIDCGNSKGLSITGSISISVWVLSKNLSGDHGIVSKMNTSNQATYDLITSGSKIRWGTTNGQFQYSNDISTNNWVHVTVVFDRQKLTNSLYINGVFESEVSTDNLNIPVNNDHLFIGAHQPGNVSNWSWNGFIDDVCIWNRVLTNEEINRLYYACAKSITKEPDNQAMFSGNALFTCFSDDTLLTYQWQTDLGTGWANLTNAGQYKGVNTDSLKVSNVSSGNNNQLFRCVVKGNCLTDTTRIVSLKVWGVGINDINQEVISVYPNPAGDVINFNLQANFREAVVKIFDASGKLVLSQTIHSTDAPQINVAQLSKGIYSVELSIDGKQFSCSFKKE